MILFVPSIPCKIWTSSIGTKSTQVLSIGNRCLLSSIVRSLYILEKKSDAKFNIGKYIFYATASIVATRAVARGLHPAGGTPITTGKIAARI